MTLIKTELKKMIDKESDLDVLNAIKILLQKAGMDITLKEKLTARALRSENNIKEKRVLNRKEVIERTNRIFSK